MIFVQNNMLVDKIIELYQKNFDIETENDIKLTIKKIRFIENEIKYVKENKPFFLFKSKRQEYNNRIKKLEELRDILYNSLGIDISS